jgi:outer membrane beta-barrel protein
MIKLIVFFTLFSLSFNVALAQSRRPNQSTATMPTPNPTPAPSPKPTPAPPPLKTGPPKANPKTRAKTPGESSAYTPPTYVSPSKLGGNRDLYDVPKVTVVANKKFYLKDEITTNLTYLATDPYEKYLALGGSYTHAFDHFWGWEVVNAAYAFAFDSGLKNDLVSNFGANATLIDELEGYATTNITVSPLYTKNLLFNSKTVYSQFAAVFGGGVSYFLYGGIEPVFDLGIMLRYFLGPNTSLKFDFRDNIFPNGYTNNNISITVGFAFDLHSK